MTSARDMHPTGPLPDTADVVVIGGGPAGAAAALTLVRADVSAVLLDAGVQRLAVGETLPPAARPVLDHLELQAMMAREGHLASTGSWSAWGGAEPWGRDFIFNRFGHGWHLDRRGFDALLREAARAAGVRVMTGTMAVASEALPSGGFQLRLNDGRCIDASIVLDASGRNAAFARQRGVKRRAIDRMIALVGYVVHRDDAEAEPAATLVEAVPHGWWYSAPLPHDRLVTMLMTDADLARGAISTESWLARLTEAPHTAARALRYGNGLAGPPVIVPAVSGRLDHFGGRDWLALGDAAASQDPLSSEGILLALESGIDGARAAIRTLRGDPDAIAAAITRREAAWRDYLTQREHHYAMERRWPNAPFWQRRHRRKDSQDDIERRSVA